MLAFWIPTLIIAVPVTSGIVVTAIHRVLQRRPPARTSARDRLIALNPTLNAAGVRWNVAARRVRHGWVTSTAVAVALLIATDRPVTARS